MDTLSAMRTFAVVARHLSFTSAANELRVSTKVVSNHVRQLEARLGVELLHRTTRNVTVTEIGGRYLERVGSVLAQFDELENLVQAHEAELAGPIRISAPTAFGSAELVAGLASFQIQHPRIEIDLRLSDQHINLIDEGIDLAVRFGDLGDSTLVARKLLDMRVVLYASPRYLNEHGRPTEPSDLSAHNCLIQQTATEPANWPFLKDQKNFHVRVSGQFRANSPRAIAHMARNHCGIGRTPLYVAAPFIESGELELILGNYESRGFPLQIVYPQTKQLTVRVRALVDHLAEHFRSY